MAIVLGFTVFLALLAKHLYLKNQICKNLTCPVLNLQDCKERFGVHISTKCTHFLHFINKDSNRDGRWCMSLIPTLGRQRGRWIWVDARVCLEPELEKPWGGGFFFSVSEAISMYLQPMTFLLEPLKSRNYRHENEWHHLNDHATTRVYTSRTLRSLNTWPYVLSMWAQLSQIKRNQPTNWAVVVTHHNSSTQGESGRLSKPAWSRVPGQPRLHQETLPQTNNTN